MHRRGRTRSSSGLLAALLLALCSTSRSGAQRVDEAGVLKVIGLEKERSQGSVCAPVEQQRATSAFVRKGEQVVWGSEIMYYDKDTMEAMMPTEEIDAEPDHLWRFGDVIIHSWHFPRTGGCGYILSVEAGTVLGVRAFNKSVIESGVVRLEGDVGVPFDDLGGGQECEFARGLETSAWVATEHWALLSYYRGPMTEAAIAESTASLKLGGQEGAQDFITLSKTDAGLTLSAMEGGKLCEFRVIVTDGSVMGVKAAPTSPSTRRLRKH